MTITGSCPYCGNKKLKVNTKSRHAYPTNITNYKVHCSRCHANGPLKPTPEQAVEAWDQRVAS